MKKITIYSQGEEKIMKQRIRLSESQLNDLIKKNINEECRINEGKFKNALLAGTLGLSTGLGMSDQTNGNGGVDVLNDRCPEGFVCSIKSEQYGDVEITRNYDDYFANIGSEQIPLGTIVSCGSGYNGTNQSLNFDNATLEWIDGNDVVFTLSDGTEITGQASKEHLSENKKGRTLRQILRESIEEVTGWEKFKLQPEPESYDYDPAEWEYDTEQPEKQESKKKKKKQAISSAGTSRNQVPSSMGEKSPFKFAPGSVNFDLGGGKYDTATDYMKGLGVENVVFDPANRGFDYNMQSLKRIEELGGADTVTVNNVLNVLKGADIILSVIQQAAECVKPDGQVIFQIYTGNKLGIGGRPKSKPDQYQQHKTADRYVPLIYRYFNKVYLKGEYIVALEPKQQDLHSEYYPAGFKGEPYTLNKANWNK